MKECFLCGCHTYTERHHLLSGSNRKWSEKYKLVVDLCHGCHRTGKNAAHRSKETADYLHKFGQKKFMKEQKATKEDFMKIFMKNYLDDEELV